MGDPRGRAGRERRISYRARIISSNWSTADTARSFRISGGALPRGCGTTAHLMSGMPLMRAIDRQASRNLSVPMSMAGMPYFSSSAWLSRPLELQAPQSPWVRMMASQRSMSCHWSRL